MSLSPTDLCHLQNEQLIPKNTVEKQALHRSGDKSSTISFGPKPDDLGLFQNIILVLESVSIISPVNIFFMYHCFYIMTSVFWGILFRNFSNCISLCILKVDLGQMGRCCVTVGDQSS